MPRFKILIVCAYSALIISNANAVYPVQDNASLAMHTKNFFETVAQNAKEVAQWADQKTKWVQDLAHYAQQIQAYKDQLLATTGVKDAVAAFNEVTNAYHKLEELYDWGMDIAHNPGDFAKSMFSQTWNQYNKYDSCSKLTGESQASCYASFGVDVTTAGLNEKALENYKEVSKSSEQLDSKIKQSQDIKTSTDLGNIIAKQSLDLQIHEARKQAILQEAQAKAKLEQKQAHEAAMEEFMKNRDTTKYFSSK